MNSLVHLEKSLRIMIIYRSYKVSFFFAFYFLINIQLCADIKNKNRLIGQSSPPISLQKLSGRSHLHIQDISKDYNIVLVFFSSKNYQSLKMVSGLHQIKAGIKSTSVQYYLVNVLEDKEFLDSFINEKVYSIPMLMDHYGIALKMFDSDVVPLTVVINKGGEISYYNQGYDDSELFNLITHIRSIK